MKIAGYQEVAMPEDAKILTAQMQDGVLCLWAMVSEPLPKEIRYITIIGTGHPIGSEYLIYIATVQAGPLVWHVFEHKP